MKAVMVKRINPSIEDIISSGAENQLEWFLGMKKRTVSENRFSAVCSFVAFAGLSSTAHLDGSIFFAGAAAFWFILSAFFGRRWWINRRKLVEMEVFYTAAFIRGATHNDILAISKLM